MAKVPNTKPDGIVKPPPPLPPPRRRMSPYINQRFRVDIFPKRWLDRIVAFANGDTQSIAESEMMQIKDAGTVLAGLHILEAVAEKAVERHAEGKAMTFADLAIVVAGGVEDAVTHSGIADKEWRPAPVKRGGRRKQESPTDS